MIKNDDVFLSVVIPAYNEEKRIIPTLQSVTDFLSHKPFKSEVIVVDDGSSDKTVALVEDFAKWHIGRITVLSGEPNHGKGYAVRRGMLVAKGQWRLFMDADNSVSISELDKFLEFADLGYEVVIGSIAHPQQVQPVIEHAGWYRRAFGSMSKLLIRALATPGIYDTQRGFKLFSDHAADVIFKRQTIERFGFDIELLVIARLHNLLIKEVPVAWENPAGSTLHLRDYWRTLEELFKIVNNKLTRIYT